MGTTHHYITIGMSTNLHGELTSIIAISLSYTTIHHLVIIITHYIIQSKGIPFNWYLIKPLIYHYIYVSSKIQWLSMASLFCTPTAKKGVLQSQKLSSRDSWPRRSGREGGQRWKQKRPKQGEIHETCGVNHQKWELVSGVNHQKWGVNNEKMRSSWSNMVIWPWTMVICWRSKQGVDPSNVRNWHTVTSKHLQWCDKAGYWTTKSLRSWSNMDLELR